MFPLQSGQNKQRAGAHNVGVRALVMGLCALLTGCGTGLFLHISPRSFDERLKLLLGGGSNVTVLLHGRGEALVVDTKFGNFSRRLRNDVELELGRKVRRIVLTHAHFDHAGGVKLFPEVAVVMVHPNARKRLEAEGVHAAFVEVEREIRLVLDGDEVRVLSIGSGHTDGDLVALLPGRKLLIAGDLVNDGFEPYCDTKFGGDILALSRTLPELMTLDFEQAVPGHGEVMTRAKVQLLADYVVALRTQVAQARAEGLSEDDVVRKVTLSEYTLKSFLAGTASREGNVRAMFRALAAEGKSR